MGRRSKIDSHPQSEEIIACLVAGEDYSAIVCNFQNITRQDLEYYTKNKLPLILSKSANLKALAERIETADINRGDTYLQLIIGLQKSALDALDMQDAKLDAKGWAMVSKEARGYLELMGKALDRIKSQPPVNITQNNTLLEIVNAVFIAKPDAFRLDARPADQVN